MNFRDKLAGTRTSGRIIGDPRPPRAPWFRCRATRPPPPNPEPLYNPRQEQRSQRRPAQTRVQRRVINAMDGQIQTGNETTRRRTDAIWHQMKRITRSKTIRQRQGGPPRKFDGEGEGLREGATGIDGSSEILRLGTVYVSVFS